MATRGTTGPHNVDAAPYTEMLLRIWHIKVDPRTKQGYSATALADHCGLSRRTLLRVLNGEGRRIQHRTAVKLEKLFEELGR